MSNCVPIGNAALMSSKDISADETRVTIHCELHRYVAIINLNVCRDSS
jgi:hypothetical protein